LPEIRPPCSLTESLALVNATTPTFVAALTPDAKPLREYLLETGFRVQGSGFRVQDLGPETWDLQHVTSGHQDSRTQANPGAEKLSSEAGCQLPTVQAGWFVGPEGDFTPEELGQLQAAGAIPVSLGKNVLRTETACLYGLCVLNSAWL